MIREWLHWLFGVKPVGGFDDVPSQRDKPSPSSHFTVEELLAKKRQQYPRRDGYFVLTVQDSNSLEPLVDDNSVVVCEDLRSAQGKKWLKAASLRAGDVCSYQTATCRQILHQIVEVDAKNRLFRFRGFNNYASDAQWVKEEEVLLRAFEFCSARVEEEGD